MLEFIMKVWQLLHIVITVKKNWSSVEIKTQALHTVVPY
jgi:hypothetical protein